MRRGPSVKNGFSFTRSGKSDVASVSAALNMVADTLKLLPRESLTTQRWSAAAWARDRRGWLFLTSTPETTIKDRKSVV